MNISKNKVIISFINSIVIYKLDKKFETILNELDFI